jgi:nucleoid-associated protein YgaU
MLRHLHLTIAASFILAGCNLAHGQDAPTAPPAPSPADSAASAGDDTASLQAENAALKKEIADAKRTIAQLQAKLAQAAPSSAGNPPDTAIDNGAPPAGATPSGPQKALPLDDTNGVANAAAPGAPAADAGPSRSYTVVKGDSLWKIAHKMYPGDTKNGVDKLQEANKDAIGGKPLKIGQVLVVPQ